MKQEGITQLAFRVEDVLAKEFKSECALRGDNMTTVFIRAMKEYIARTKAEKNSEQLLDLEGQQLNGARTGRWCLLQHG